MPIQNGNDISDPVLLDTEEQNLLFHSVIQRSLSGILIFQEDRVVFSNPALQEMVGLSEDEILSRNPFDLVHTIDRDLVRQRAAQRLLGASPPDDYEFRILSGDGKIKWVRLLATSITYRGKPAVLANILDIDERLRAEEQLRENIRLRTTLLDSLPHPAMLIRRDRIILAANLHARDLGARTGELCGSEFGRRAFTPETSGDIQPQAENPMASKASRCRFCRADQALDSRNPLSIRSLAVYGRYWDAFWIPVDEDTYLHYAIDVTEQREIEQTIRNSEERYRLVTDTMTDGLSIQNREGIISQVNRRLCEMTGFARHELIGRQLADLFVKKDQFSTNPADVQGDRAEMVAETFIHQKSGRSLAVSLKLDFLIDEEDNHKGSFAFFSDISELKMLRCQALNSDEFENIVGRERSMRKLFAEIIELAACDFPVLIQGESGVGKELVAQAIHNQSLRCEAMFVPVNCGALPEGLLESELFGHVKGAFTGAIRDRKGRFELAHGGTIFLDEIAELSPAMQVKLLRILQEGVFERVGDHRSLKVNARVISATNKDLEREMKAGRFRRDLYYRLCVMPVMVPPLRERKNDIPPLIDHFIKSASGRTPHGKTLLAPETLALLMTYDWPGNVRELRNAVQYASAKIRGDVIQPVHLPPVLRSPRSKSVRRRNRQRKLDQELVQDALRRTGGNKLKAAQRLGVNRSTLYRFLSESKDKPGQSQP